MFAMRCSNFLVGFLVLVLNGCHACFRTNEHQIISKTTGSSFYQECQCTEPDINVDNLRWLDNNDRPIESLPLGPGTSSNIYTEKLSDRINLYISSITKPMSGVYKCVAQVDGIAYTHSYNITAYEKLYFFKTPIDQFLVYGQTSEVTCLPRSDSAVVVTWQKGRDDPIEIFSDDKYIETNTGLTVNNVTKDDEGEYKCTARVIATNEEVDKYITVKVITKPEIIKLVPTPATIVVVGDKLTIECIADGKPHPDYVWNKTLTDGDSNNGTWRQELNTLIFDSIQPGDNGSYSCYAYNPAGFATSETFVEVLIPPEITNFPNITQKEGSTIQLICNATGNSEPNISIAYLGKDFSSDTEYINHEDIPNLAFINVDRSQGGIYECNATNEVGSVLRAMVLSVLYRPYFDIREESVWGWNGKTINLTCVQDSNPPATITWRFQSNDILTDQAMETIRKLLLTLNAMPEPYFTLNIDNETAYGIYECSAKNEFGEDTKRITLREGFRPDAVKNASYGDLTATSVTFNIEGPDNVIGPSLQAFTAQYDESKNYNITDIHINRTWTIDRPFKLDKLKPNTTYYVRFAPLNEVGTGEWSEYLEFTTFEKSVPEAPVWDAEPITLTRNSHVLKWKAPDDNGEPIDNYALLYCPIRDEELCKSQRISPTTRLELADLEFNTTYTFGLVAHNAIGYSSAANITVIVPSPNVDPPSTLLSGGAVIGISIVIVVLCLLLLDVLLLVWRRQGIIATCCFKKDNKRKENTEVNSRDKKGLLTNGEAEEARLNPRPNNEHKKFEYNKNTGIVTGKHSAV